MDKKNKIYVILDNIRSIHNVGSIFRTADGAGIDKIFLCGVTPTPIDRFGRKRPNFHKVALGAEDFVPFEYNKKTENVVRFLKREGVEIVTIEQSDKPQNYKNFFPKGDCAFVFGAEVEGVSPEVIKMSDKMIEIPMHGKKESLNVSVTVGIVLFNIKN